MTDIIKQCLWLLSGERVGIRTRMGARKTIRRICLSSDENWLGQGSGSEDGEEWI